MATINFNGLASGLDTKSIVEQLTQIKQSQLITPVSTQLNLVRAKKSALSPISSNLSSLRSAAKALNDADNAAYAGKKTESSNSATVQVTATDAAHAVTGTYNITNISQLAQPDRVIMEGVANTGVTQFGTGTVSITYKGVTSSVAIDSTNNTLDGIRSAINDADLGITASIINDGTGATPYRLVLTSDTTGSDTTITQDLATALTGSATSLVVDSSSSNAANEPADASFRVNSVVFTSHTNSIDDAIPGVTFQLLALETTDTITLTVKQDTSAILSKIQSFVSALNSARDGLKKAIDPDENNRFGPLGHDNLLQEVYYEVGRIAALRIPTAGTYKSLAEIGITADRKGVYSIDSGKLTTILESDSSLVRKIFQGTTLEDGIAEKIYNYTDTLVNPLGTFATRQKQYNDSTVRLNKLLVDRNQALSNYRKKLQNQFNKLETTISTLKGQQDQLTGLASTISGVGNN